MRSRHCYCLFTVTYVIQTLATGWNLLHLNVHMMHDLHSLDMIKLASYLLLYTWKQQPMDCVVSDFRCTGTVQFNDILERKRIKVIFRVRIWSSLRFKRDPFHYCCWQYTRYSDNCDCTVDNTITVTKLSLDPVSHCPCQNRHRHPHHRYPHHQHLKVSMCQYIIHIFTRYNIIAKIINKSITGLSFSRQLQS